MAIILKSQQYGLYINGTFCIAITHTSILSAEIWQLISVRSTPLGFSYVAGKGCVLFLVSSRWASFSVGGGACYFSSGHFAPFFGANQLRRKGYEQNAAAPCAPQLHAPTWQVSQGGNVV